MNSPGSRAGHASTSSELEAAYPAALVKPIFASEAKHGILDTVDHAPAKVGLVLRWEILEIIERDGVLMKSQLYRPLGADEAPDGYHLPFHPDNDISQLISAALFDGFEPVSHSIVVLPDGSLQQHWVFRLQIMD